MKIAITGGNGFVGSSLALRLLESGEHEVTIYSNKKLEYLDQISKYTYKEVVCDLSIEKTYIEMVENDVIYHLAQANLGASKDILSDLLINSLSSGFLIQECIKRKKSPLIILASTYNISRTNTESPPSIWSLHKKFSEQYINYYGNNYSGKVFVIRIANVYGVPVNINKYEKSALNKMREMAVNGGLKLFNNAQKKRAFIHVDDLVNCLVKLIYCENKRDRLLFAAEKRLIKYEEIANILLKELNGAGQIKITRDYSEMNLIDMQEDQFQRPNIFEYLNITPSSSVENFLRGKIK
jgi:UDP-glucuronate 4-epimerase